VIGIITRGGLHLGDTISESEPLQFTGLPFFAPEIFRNVILADPMRSQTARQRTAGPGRGGRDPGVPAA
jgi:peptide chain release factor 3